MPVVGTAGHVDHGKSTLVSALTGRDPDRWDEEKRRGLTIDLGFAWTTLDDDVEVGFVDVPGHERFIKNMLAGVDAVDVALLVVAADEGWMPQSEEHLAVLDLLGITRGVVALTRSDLVENEQRAQVAADVARRLKGTTLEGSPVIPVAAPIGHGVAEVRRALGETIRMASVRAGGRTRMWIDRSFVIEGAGTVVTGTLVGGSIASGDEVEVHPGPLRARVRTLHSHERSVEQIDPGNRTAINLAGIDRDQVARGAMLGRPGQWKPTSSFAASMRVVRHPSARLENRGSHHLHVGSGTWACRVRLLDTDRVGPEESAMTLVGLDDPVPLATGDPFIIRDVGRRMVVAGGRVLDPGARSARAAGGSIELLPDPDAAPDEAATSLLEIRGRERLDVLAAHTGGGVPDAAIVAAGEALSEAKAAALVEFAVAECNDFHRESPLRPGIPAATLADRLGIGRAVLEALVAAETRLAADGGMIHAAGFSPALDDDQQLAWDEAREVLAGTGAAPPRVDALGIGPELLHALIRAGALVRVSEEYAYLPETMESVVATVRGMSDGFTVAELRDALGVTRKHAVPLAEWLDAAGHTRREGDLRFLMGRGEERRR